MHVLRDSVLVTWRTWIRRSKRGHKETKRARRPPRHSREETMLPAVRMNGNGESKKSELRRIQATNKWP